MTDDIIKELERRMKSEQSGKITDDMIISITIRPLVLCHMVWHYAKLAADYARDRRIHSLSRSSRQLRILHDEYVNYVTKVLGEQGVENIAVYATDFLNIFENDLELFYWPANQALKNTRDNITHEQMRTYALMSAYLGRLAIRVENNARRDVKMKMGCDIRTIIPRMLFNIGMVLSNYIGADTFCKIDFENLHLQRALDVLYNDLYCIRCE